MLCRYFEVPELKLAHCQAAMTACYRAKAFQHAAELLARWDARVQQALQQLPNAAAAAAPQQDTQQPQDAQFGHQAAAPAAPALSRAAAAEAERVAEALPAMQRRVVSFGAVWYKDLAQRKGAGEAERRAAQEAMMGFVGQMASYEEQRKWLER